MNNFIKKSKAFTLLEIIVVLVIVGVLTSIALPNLYSWIEKSRAAEGMLVLGTLKNNLEAKIAKSGLPLCLDPGPAATVNPFYKDWLLEEFDKLNTQMQYFKGGNALTTDPIKCNNLHFGIGIDRNMIFPFDPCVSGTCMDNSCGAPIVFRPSGLKLCRDPSGKYTITGFGFYSGI